MKGMVADPEECEMVNTCFFRFVWIITVCYDIEDCFKGENCIKVLIGPILVCYEL
jgi:hypothetical protein